MGEDRDCDAPPDGQALGGDDRLMEEIRSTFVVPIEARVAAGHIANAISAMPGEPPPAVEEALGERIRRRLASVTVFSGLTAKILTGAVALAAVGGTVASANGVGLRDIAEAIGFSTDKAVVAPVESTTTTSADDPVEPLRETSTTGDDASASSGGEDARDPLPDGSPVPQDLDEGSGVGDGGPGDISGDGGGSGDRPGDEGGDGGDGVPLPDPSP